MHSLTLSPGFFQKAHFSIALKTLFSLPCMQTSRISTWFITNYAKFAHFTKLPKCSDQQTKFQIQFSSRNYFSKHTIFHMHMDISSKVIHAKYAVAKTCISGLRLITVIHVLKLFLQPLLTMYQGGMNSPIICLIILYMSQHFLYCFHILNVVLSHTTRV